MDWKMAGEHVLGAELETLANLDGTAMDGLDRNEVMVKDLSKTSVSRGGTSGAMVNGERVKSWGGLQRLRGLDQDPAEAGGGSSPVGRLPKSCTDTGAERGSGGWNSGAAVEPSKSETEWKAC